MVCLNVHKSGEEKSKQFHLHYLVKWVLPFALNTKMRPVDKATELVEERGSDCAKE